MLMDSFYHSQSTDDSLTGFKVVPHTSTVLFVNTSVFTHIAVCVEAHWES